MRALSRHFPIVLGMRHPSSSRAAVNALIAVDADGQLRVAASAHRSRRTFNSCRGRPNAKRIMRRFDDAFARIDQVAAPQGLPAAEEEEPPPPLPGGFAVGEMLYYIGPSEMLRRGERVVHGEQGAPETRMRRERCRCSETAPQTRRSP